MWTRRTLLRTFAAAPASSLLQFPAEAAAPSPAAPSPGAPVDPAYEIGAPLPPEAARDVPRRGRHARPPAAGAPSRVGEGDRITVQAVNTDVPFTFKRYDFEIRELSPGSRPYRLSTPMPVEGWGTVDEHGVRMVNLSGKLYDHPVNQAQYGINLLECYRLTNDVRYLDNAKCQAQRLIDRKVAYGGGWFYPYPFRYALHRVYDIYEPPWYSQMAQGQALSLFVRLYQVTGETAYQEAADRTFATFLVRPVAGKPWGVYVVNNLLWLEEYPNPKAVRGDRTYNGHIFSAWGLWDYWVLTKDERAKLLLQGALTTARDVHLEIRRPQWRSKYCLTHGKDAGTYHTTHITQHLLNHAITGDPAFARISDLYYSDFPVHGVSGQIRFEAGDHTGYKFDAQGRVVASKKIRLSRYSYAPSAERDKVLNQGGVWYNISAGALAGYRVKETPARVFQLGEYAALGYRIDRKGKVIAAPLKAYTIDSAGRMKAVTTTYKVGDMVTVDRRAYLNGVQHLRLASGDYAGRWVGAAAILLTT
ncbi:D-glucuronyl C5-epimerase family protein [Carbonactinospora thermoautotrophica]|uniref:D-glucuronyl C5-epimerase family protein n=1 Tax=Carbonactinospora thermoautotrophica TaxID=1469144 RepID=UPI0018E362AE|nr:D-glucuronyl C5-epimerase family protein [Carbonactinospora thermoautotrophica]